MRIYEGLRAIEDDVEIVKENVAYDKEIEDSNDSIVPSLLLKLKSKGKDEGEHDELKPVTNKCPFLAHFPQRLELIKNLNKNLKIF